MLIANPIYDRIESIEAKARELTHISDENEEQKTKPEVSLLRLMRLDLVAAIRTETGKYSKVLLIFNRRLH